MRGVGVSTQTRPSNRSARACVDAAAVPSRPAGGRPRRPPPTAGGARPPRRSAAWCSPHRSPARDRRRLGHAPHIVGDPADRRADDHDSAPATPSPDRSFRGRSLPAGRPGRASPGRARPRSPRTPVPVRSARPIDPPISPTPTIATVPRRSKLDPRHLRRPRTDWRRSSAEARFHVEA